MGKSQTRKLKAAALRTQKKDIAKYHILQSKCGDLARHIKATGDYHGSI